ncbi:DAK2 domain-containing protein [Castellaniella sp.]|uniref:DAK2 domain-containing protein n=1 Tax=Castellaniella sp. TaxID=1955812 RepID=UPI00355E1AA7
MDDSFTRRWLANFSAAFELEKAHLGALDRAAGDGDFAVNLAQALKRATAGIQSLAQDASDAQVLAAAANGFLHTGGTSGPLLGMWLRELAKAQASTAVTLTTLAAGVAAGTASVQRLGGARPGDRTMVDAMLPATAALQKALENGAPLEQGLDQAARAAQQGAEATAHMTARLGRASYVGDAAAGVIDPGALAIALFFRAGAQACNP